MTLYLGGRPHDGKPIAAGAARKSDRAGHPCTAASHR